MTHETILHKHVCIWWSTTQVCICTFFVAYMYVIHVLRHCLTMCRAEQICPTCYQFLWYGIKRSRDKNHCKCKIMFKCVMAFTMLPQDYIVRIIPQRFILWWYSYLESDNKKKKVYFLSWKFLYLFECHHTGQTWRVITILKSNLHTVKNKNKTLFG